MIVRFACFYNYSKKVTVDNIEKQAKNKTLKIIISILKPYFPKNLFLL